MAAISLAPRVVIFFPLQEPLSPTPLATGTFATGNRGDLWLRSLALSVPCADLFFFLFSLCFSLSLSLSFSLSLSTFFRGNWTRYLPRQTKPQNDRFTSRLAKIGAFYLRRIHKNWWLFWGFSRLFLRRARPEVRHMNDASRWSGCWHHEARTANHDATQPSSFVAQSGVYNLQSFNPPVCSSSVLQGVHKAAGVNTKHGLRVVHLDGETTSDKHSSNSCTTPSPISPPLEIVEGHMPKFRMSQTCTTTDGTKHGILGHMRVPPTEGSSSHRAAECQTNVGSCPAHLKAYVKDRVFQTEVCKAVEMQPLSLSKLEGSPLMAREMDGLQVSGLEPGGPSNDPVCPWSSFASFFDFLASFSLARNFLAFLSVFPFFPRDFRVQHREKILVFFWWFSLLLPKRKKARKGRSGDEKPPGSPRRIDAECPWWWQ